MYCVYLLKSKKHDQVYLGSTNNLARRLDEHNSGKEQSTRRYMPWVLVYYEAYAAEKLARLREMKLKYHGRAFSELKKRAGFSEHKNEEGLPSTTFNVGSEHKNEEGLPSTTFNVGSEHKSGAGFTIIELLIVVAIMVIMSALVLPRLLSSNIRKEFDSTVETIFYSLNQARERAIAWENGTTWGVFFEKGGGGSCSSQPHFGIFFNNDGYKTDIGSGVKDKINYVSYLPLTMDFDSSTWGTYTGCYRIIDFKEVTGERWNPPADPASTSSVKVYVIKNPSISSTISVTPLGMVSYTTSSAQ